MNKMMSIWVCAMLVGLPAVFAQTDEATQDHIKIEKTTIGDAKVTVVADTDTQSNGVPAVTSAVAGTDTQSNGVPAVATAKPTANIVRAPVVPDTTPHKARLAVLPAVFSTHFQPVFKFSEKIESSGKLNLKMMFTTEHEARLEAPSFTLALAEAFVGSRKFDVLERTRLSEAMKEIDFGQSDYADASKVVPMGKALNAEYVVLPEVEVIHLVQEAKDVPYVDTIQPKLEGKMIVRLQVVDTASTKIVAACTEEVQVKRTLKANNPFLETEINDLVVDLYKAASLRLLHRTLETVYPVRMLEVDGDKVVLNRGEGAISVGDELEVYSLGKAYKDQDTGEMLGQSESKMATIKVNKVAPKFSEAEILDGASQLTGDLKRYLCRETTNSIAAKVKLDEKPIAW